MGALDPRQGRADTRYEALRPEMSKLLIVNAEQGRNCEAAELGCLVLPYDGVGRRRWRNQDDGLERLSN